jgi:hypothetical protein
MCYLGEVPPTFDRAGKGSELSLSLSVTRIMLPVLLSIVKALSQRSALSIIATISCSCVIAPSDDKGRATNAEIVWL